MLVQKPTQLLETVTDPQSHTRSSANVVLLAHGNRSLHVLTIQRNQTSIFSKATTCHKDQTPSLTVTYKL